MSRGEVAGLGLAASGVGTSAVLLIGAARFALQGTPAGLAVGAMTAAMAVVPSFVGWALGDAIGDSSDAVGWRAKTKVLARGAFAIVDRPLRPKALLRALRAHGVYYFQTLPADVAWRGGGVRRVPLDRWTGWDEAAYVRNAGRQLDLEVPVPSGMRRRSSATRSSRPTSSIRRPASWSTRSSSSADRPSSAGPAPTWPAPSASRATATGGRGARSRPTRDGTVAPPRS
jgi:hypothetical protein